MNANELADVLMSTKFQVDEDGTMIGVSHQAVNEAVTMLRQQQAEIEVLRNSHIELERGIVKDLNQRQSAEPVAWINREEGSGSILDWEKDPYSEVNIPLYTHPVKELTDEEIEELARKMGMHLYDYEIDSLGNCLNFARAILRKAQEKC